MKKFERQHSLKSFYLSIVALAIIFTLWIKLVSLGNTMSIDNVLSCPLHCPVDDASMYLSNRMKLSKQFTNISSIEFIMAASQRPIRVNSDTDYPGYRQSSNIIYILGLMNISPSLVHVYWNGSSLNLTLFIPLMSQRERIFGGDLLDFDELKRLYQLDSVLLVSDFLNWTKNNKSMYTISPIDDISSALGSKVMDELKKRSISFTLNDEILEAFHHARFLKSLKEVEMIGYATKVAKWAHNKISNLISSLDEISEMDLASSFNYHTSLCGGRLSAYNPIVGFGIDSATLHFRTGENETRGYMKLPSKNPMFILIDAAPEYKGYASDITRTIYPKDSKRHVKIYEMVKECQSVAISSFVYGSTWQNVERDAYISLTKSLLTNDFFHKDTSLEQLLLEKAYFAFMPHGLGHPVGLDVHDPIPKSLGKSYILDNGIVHTIEPGIYFIPFFISSLKTNASSIGRFINWTTVDEYMDIGGVRIEDVLTIVNKKSIIL